MDIVFKPVERVKWLVLVVVLALHISGAHGQDAIISFQLTPPYDQPLIEYKDKLNTSITVPGQNELSAFLAVSIFNDNRSIEIMSTPAGRKPVELVPGGNMFNGSDFDDLIDLNRLNVQGIGSNAVFFDQGLPPGRYFFCLELYNERGEQISNTACTNIAVDVPPVAVSLIFLPPYNVPFDNFQDQTTLTFTTPSAFTATLEMTVVDVDGAITIGKNSLVNLEEGTNLFTGTDLAFYFSSGGFSTLSGVNEAQLFDTGLPPGAYFLTFNLITEGVPVASTSRQFLVPASTITMNASITPAYDVPLDELLSQTTLTITSSGNVSDAFVTVEISGERTGIISEATAASNRVNLTANVPEVLTAGDLINVAGTGVQFQGITPQEALNTGLPGGNYSVCFRLFDTTGQPLTEVASCFSLNVPPALINLTVQAVPPFIRQVEDLYSMLRVNVTATRDLEIGFSVRIQGDNGVAIAGRAVRSIPETFALEKNLPQLLMNSDLLSYFDPNQLVILGANRNNLFTNGLPVGNYQICLTPIVTNGPPVENLMEVCSNPVPVNIIEAPQLILPTCGETFDIQRGQVIPFNWLPTPGAPQDTEYTLKIVEMLNPRQNPYDALLTSTEPVFFEETVMRTNFLYGPGQPLLEPGRKYAYQVLIADEFERGNYTNDGLSEACWFQVADVLPPEEGDEEDRIRSRQVVVQPIENNPFPGYSFPVTSVSGTLKYKFRELRSSREADDNNNATSYQVGINTNLPSILQPNTSPAFSDVNQTSVAMTIRKEGITYAPPFNESDLSTDDSFTMPAGVNIRLIEGYLVYGTLYGEAVTGAFVGDPWGRAPKTVAATTTGPNGAFEFTFIQYDSLGLPMTLPLGLNGAIASGTFFKVYRLVVDNPYYYSPEMNIVVQPWEHINVGNPVSYVHEYQLKVIVKTGIKPLAEWFGFGNDQMDSIGTTLTLVNTEIKRTVGPNTWPYAEGQNLPGLRVSEGATDANGAVVFNKLVRHNLNNPLDQYQITVATNQYEGQYNYETITESYPQIDSPEGSIREHNSILFNSEWQTENYEHTITMYPDMPRVFGEVSAQQPPAQLAERRQSPNINNGTFSSNSSYQNFLSSSLGQLGLSVSEVSDVYANIPNWSEMVNTASLPDVTVKLGEINNFWDEDATNNTTTYLQRQSDDNGQFSFDNLELEMDFNQNALVVGPKRFLMIEHPGYTHYYKDIPPDGFLKWGQQYEDKDIVLEPDGFVFGYVEDDRGNPVKSEVFIGEFTSAITVQDQEMQNALGIPGALKEVFLIKAPSGGNIKLNVVPDNPIYAPSDYTVSISENNTAIPQSLGGFEVNLYKHRITLQVTEEEKMAGSDRGGKYPTGYYPPIKNALVKVTNLLTEGPATNTQSSQPSTGGLGLQQPDQSNLINSISEGDPIYGYTDEQGLVTLSFSNNAQEFQIEVIPPADTDFAKEYLTVTSEPSGQPVFAGRVVLEKAWRISGKVTYGNDSTPLPYARVFIDDDLEVYTNSYGEYLLKHVPQSFPEYTITAENRDHPLTLIAETKTVQMPSGELNFNLTEFADFEIKELMGIPVTVKSVVPDGANYLLDGAFINLPGNGNFSLKDTEAQLDFHQIPITSITKNGKQVAKVVNSTVTLDVHELDLINYTKFLAKHLPSYGTQLKMTRDSAGVGELKGKVLLLNSSFDFNEQYMSFNEETSSTLRGSQSGQYSLTTSASPALITDNLRRSYIDLFNDLSQFRLFDDQQNSNVVKTLTAGNYPLRPFGVSDQNNNDYEFKVQAFNAVAKKEESYVYQDSLVLSTRLSINNIPLAIPKALDIDIGDIIVTSEGFSEILGGDPLTFKLEEWEVTCPDWTLDPNSTGIKVPKGKIDFGLFTTEILNIKLLPNDLQIGGVNLNKVKLGDLVPVNLKPWVTTSFGIDNAAGTDNQPHWVLSFIGQNGQPAAAVKGLPGMLSSDEITMQEVMLLSNGEQDLVIGNQDQWLTFYNVIKVQPDQFTMLQGGLQLSASLDLEIPLLEKSYGSFRYTQQNGQLQSQFLGMDVNFTMPGNTRFVGSEMQILEQNKFEATGQIKHENKIKLLTRLVKDLDSAYVYVDPLHQTLPITQNGSSWMAEITGQSKAIPGTWNKFMFSGDFMGMKGVEDSKRRKTFTINGSINAENEGLDVKNISSSFGGMQITYDIENNRLTGSLDFDQDFASVQVKGHADYLADSDGWLFIAGGSFTTPGFGKLSAGLGIGDYGNMNTLIAGNSIEYLLLQEARNKQLPDIFQNGFSGFFFTGMKDIPQLSLPKTTIFFVVGEVSLEVVTGFDARLWMGFDNGASEFGIGVMAFSELTLMLDVAITCTSLYGYLGAELLVQGIYNTGSGAFSLEGCASITIAGAVEQCTPVPFTPICELCVSECGSLGVKAFMNFISDGTLGNTDVDVGFALGSCSGKNPLSQEIKDKFNCN